MVMRFVVIFFLLLCVTAIGITPVLGADRTITVPNVVKGVANDLSMGNTAQVLIPPPVVQTVQSSANTVSTEANSFEIVDMTITTDSNITTNDWRVRGYLLNEKGLYEEAVQAFNTALELEPNNADIWYNKGYALNELRRFEEAIHSFDKVLQIDPKYEGALYGKGLALNNLGKKDEAAVMFNTASMIEQE